MAEPGLGLYVYCVLPAGEQPPLDGVGGVRDAAGLAFVTQGALGAVVSRVSLDEFGADALRRNLEDMAWLEQTARAHQAVLDRALAADAVVPMRLCTVFSDEAHLREMLEREQTALLAALDHVRNHSEWSVKVLADLAKAEALARSSGGAEAAGESGEGAGRAYLARKKLERSVREEAGALVDSAAEHIHSRLREEAVAATVLPPQRRELSGRSGEMVLNGAYLIPRERADAFIAVVDDLRGRNRELGLEVELGGPWAPYNFVGAETVG